MARSKSDLPIILSHDTHTGIMVFPNRKMGGRDVLIVGLNRDGPSGETFEMDDIDWIKSVLHFSDIGALQITVDVLEKGLKQWRGEQDEM